MLDKINIDMKLDFEDEFDSHLFCNECGGKLCYAKNKTDKLYFADALTTDEQIEALMKKSLASGHDYLLDAVKDNECPPYDPDCIY